ncbi:MAG: bacillithiol transferase BstA [Cyclobacteriaceae bacterium]|nr:bacillithiol transferase BstA [Cyclobacteriaceae bacterium]
MSSHDHRFPIGPFRGKDTYQKEELDGFIQQISTLPDQLTKEVDGMIVRQLDTPYRDGGWTVRQVIHHLADSHMNAYIRMKWTLTENSPIIKAYDEKVWAETEETKFDPQNSLLLLKALHAKWVSLMKSFTSADLKREFIHPETKKNISLEKMIALYAWHGNHHVAHITSIKQRKGWN